jgi:excinuclease ABC subunit C
MSEVVFRRYKRLLEENQPLPQLIVIDGGKGQLSAALESIDLLTATYGNKNPFADTTLVGLAKNEEEIFFKGDSQSFKLPWDSESLKLLRRIRDEVHRFGITFHRNLRSQGAFTNELEGIQGIGNATSSQLLKAFKSVKNIKQKTMQELEAVVGLSKAKILQAHFNNVEL